ncbi:uracil-DNA glycosylase-like protein [Rhodotorula diobovata]|uniref:Uracil-DNA glycosylase-like protein n=1 Tax=Rhodotorula diobovata TaxID=5288 RepID=A0A5C5FN67_9BASI|nr:uracil-DNA glycosylase-like protein [Rhodotorula diobovata]
MQSPGEPVVRSPAFQAHLERFRCSPSPTSSRSSPRPRLASHPPKPPTPVSVKAETPSMISCPPTKSPAKRPRSRTVSTPPRPDGTSAHFHPKVEDSDEALAASEPNESSAPPSQKKKKKRPPRPYADPSEYAHLGDDPLPDYLDQGLAVLLCGINPGVKSAQLGLHYANPTNHYWRCLSESGMTPRLLHPSEGPSLPSFGIGSTNLVERPTAEMSEISNQEMMARVPRLLRKVVQFKPRMLAFVGMKICEVVMRYLHNLPLPASRPSASPGRRKAMPKVKIGLQPAVLSLGESGAKIYLWCLPSTSARVVEYQLVDKVEIWKLLKADMDRVVQSPPFELALPDGTIEYSADSLFPANLSPAAGCLAHNVTLIRAEDLCVSTSGVRAEREKALTA